MEINTKFHICLRNEQFEDINIESIQRIFFYEESCEISNDQINILKMPKKELEHYILKISQRVK